MPQFMGHHLNRLDAKGRVMIPASFRAALRHRAQGEAQGGSQGGPPAVGPVTLVVRPSHVHDCLEGWPPEEFVRLADPLQSLPLFSPDHDDLAVTIYGDAHELESDREGRIVLPEALTAHARLTEGVAFLGVGRYFQIWEPHAADQRRSTARERTRSGGVTLPGMQRLPGTPAP
jgi:MraZ protein